MKSRFIMFAFAVALAGMAAFGQEWATGDVTATLDGGTLTISGSGSMGDYYNGEYYNQPFNDYPPWYDVGESITSVVIEEGVTRIGLFAFWGSTNLTSVTIPQSVIDIEIGSFFACSKLKTINIHPENTEYIVIDDILYTEDLETLVLYPAGKSERSVIIPDGVRNITELAFIISRIESVTMPNSVRRIGRYAFASCFDLKSIDIPSSVTSIAESVFFACYNLTSVTIPDGVTSIGARAFRSCRSLTTITIPSSVKSIGSEAFAGCEKLTSVTNLNPLPQGLGKDAFGINVPACSLLVPAEAIGAYSTADGWKDFKILNLNGEAASVLPRAYMTSANSSLPHISVRGRTLTVSNLQSSSAPIQLRVLDLRGKTVSSFSAAKSDVGVFSLSKIPAGKYLVELRRSGARLETMSVMVR
nr:hypothetical protein [uncultured bacterium]